MCAHKLTEYFKKLEWLQIWWIHMTFNSRVLFLFIFCKNPIEFFPFIWNEEKTCLRIIALSKLALQLNQKIQNKKQVKFGYYLLFS